MSFNTCPIATADAPIDQVWRLLADPSRYALWWDARTVSITPDGPAQAGQRVIARTTALGREWPVHLTIQRVDARKRELDLTTRLPLGITVHNHIACTSVDPRQTRISFG
jgi:hypothetical protein